MRTAELVRAMMSAANCGVPSEVARLRERVRAAVVDPSPSPGLLSVAVEVTPVQALHAQNVSVCAVLGDAELAWELFERIVEQVEPIAERVDEVPGHRATWRRDGRLWELTRLDGPDDHAVQFRLLLSVRVP